MVYGGRWLILKWIYETLQAVLAVSKGMNETMKQCSDRAEASRDAGHRGGGGVKGGHGSPIP